MKSFQYYVLLFVGAYAIWFTKDHYGPWIYGSVTGAAFALMYNLGRWHGA